MEAHVPSPEHPSTEAVLHGVLNPAAPGEAGTYEFLYKAGATCVGGTAVPIPPGLALGGEHEEVSETLTGLTPNTKYTVCLIVHNSEPVPLEARASVTFTTALPPETPVTQPATAVTGTTATLNGELNPAGPRNGWLPLHLRLGRDLRRLRDQPGRGSHGQENQSSTPASELEGSTVELEGSTEYTFCLVATNAAGETATGAPLKFKTPTTAPVIPSETAPTVTPVGATLEAKVNPENQATKYKLQYAGSKKKLEKGEGVTVLTEGVFPGVAEEQTVGPAETGPVLTPSTTYYYRVVATNGTGTEDGKVEDIHDGSPGSSVDPLRERHGRHADQRRTARGHQPELSEDELPVQAR